MTARPLHFHIKLKTFEALLHVDVYVIKLGLILQP